MDTPLGFGVRPGIHCGKGVYRRNVRQQHLRQQKTKREGETEE
jgi:hypothetical protein